MSAVGSWWCRTVIVSVTTLWATFACAGTIDPTLQDRMNEVGAGDLIGVLFIMDSQLDMETINVQGLDRIQKRAVLKAALKSHASTSQAPLLSAMESLPVAQATEGLMSSWMLNGVFTRANVAAIENLAARSDVRVAILSETESDEVSPQISCGNCQQNAGCVPPPVAPCCLSQAGPCWHCVPATLEIPSCAGHQPNTISWAISWIQADDVWDLGYRGDGVVLGFLDGGMDYMHSDLAPNHLLNIGDPPGDAWPNPCGSDDDCNGLIDDYKGWNFRFFNTNNDPIDAREGAPVCDSSAPLGGTHSHGTSALGAAIGAGVGTRKTGVAPHAWFIPIRLGRRMARRTPDAVKLGHLTLRLKRLLPQSITLAIEMWI